MACALLLASSLQAVPFTWDGGGADNNVTTAQNWVGDIAPGASADIVWAGTTRLAVNVDTDGQPKTLTFDSTAGAFVIGGVATTLSSGITNNSVSLETINVALTLTAAQAINAASGNLVLGGATLANGGFLLTASGANNTSISNVISGTGGLTKTGTGTLTLLGVNTHTGATIITAGTLAVDTIGDGGVAGNLGQATNAAANLVFNGGELDYTGATASTNRNFTINAAKTATFDITVNTLTISGASTGTNGALTKLGAGTLTLSGANAYTGATAVVAGVLNIQNATGLGTAVGGTTISSGAALQVQGGITVGTEALTLNGNGISNDGALRNISGNNSWSGNLTLGSVSSIASDAGTLTLSGTLTNGGFGLTLAGAGNVVENGVISGTGGLTKSGGGTLTLAGVNTYSGGTTINGGTVAVNSGSSLGASGVAATINAGTLEVTATFSSTRNFTLGNATSTIMVDPAQTFTIGNVISGTGGLTKTATGTLTLSGVNIYTGNTTVNAGTLILATSSGSALGSVAGITVNTGGTLLLGANDQINNSATMSLGGGTFAKGNFSEGTANSVGVGAVTLTATGSTLEFGAGTVGALSFASLNAATFTLTINNWTGTANTIGNAGTDRLVFDSDQTSNLSSFNFTGYGPGAVEFALGNGFFEITPVAESSTWCAGGLAAAVICFQLRCRMRTVNPEVDSPPTELNPRVVPS